jgi:hypothetical protein
MTPYPLFTDAAWLRLCIVGIDILAVIVTVRLCSGVAVWWRTLRPPGHPIPAAARIGRRPHVRF